MSTSLSSALRIATGGMQYSQIALGTISHNIANANTAGYSRQEVSASAVSFDGFGAGVQLNGINRITDQQLQNRLLAQQSDKQFADTTTTYYGNVSSIFNPNGTSSGLSDNINSLFSAMSQLSNSPNDSALQRSVVEAAGLLTQNIQSASNSLSSLGQRVDTQITSDVSTINTALQRINDLNTTIAQQHISGNGSNANDLEDARDAQVSILANMFKLNINQDATTGALRISTETGRRLVDESGYVQFERTTPAVLGDPQGIGYRNVLTGGKLSPNLIEVDTDQLSSGEIKALVNIRDDVIPNMQDQLDTLTNTLLLGSVNNLASQGTSFPAVNSLTSGSTSSLAAAGSDILAGLGLNSTDTFDVSVVDSQGNVVATTVGGTAISLAPTLPATTFSLTNLATAINTNVSIGNTALGGSLGVTASVGTDANGKPTITMAAANGNLRIVLANKSGNVLGKLGMNTLFTGTGSGDIAVKASIAGNPSLLPSAQMRSTDGGVSSLNADNMTALAQLADSTISFSASGGLPAATVTGSGYANSIASNLAVQSSDATSRSTFAGNVYDQLTQQMGSVSGVNLNEELSQMLIFQQGFQASAHIISVVGSLMDTLFQVVNR